MSQNGKRRKWTAADKLRTARGAAKTGMHIDTGSESDFEVVERKKELRDGNPKFLAEAAHAIMLSCRIWGIFDDKIRKAAEEDREPEAEYPEAARRGIDLSKLSAEQLAVLRSIHDQMNAGKEGDN
jgi:hypothetical protein